MFFSLIICTYKRALPLQRLLLSIQKQETYPSEILIIDGSPDNETESLLTKVAFDNLKYYKVPPEHRGLTKQRNFGISKLNNQTAIVCFLDDDTVLESEYFSEILKVFKSNIDISGVGGVAINENKWQPIDLLKKYNSHNYYFLDGFLIEEALRNKLRNYLGLQSNLKPGMMPEFSNGRTCGYPLNDKNYEVDLLVGMSMSFRVNVIQSIQFSTYFEGYGLYEDADFSIRALQYGKNIICTKAQLAHYHNPSGRPNQYAYGKMVVRNGWYVWRVKYPQPSLKAKLKWHAIVWLLTIVRLSNAFNTSNKKEAFTESCGRIIGWLSLLLNKPKIEKS